MRGIDDVRAYKYRANTLSLIVVEEMVGDMSMIWTTAARADRKLPVHDWNDQAGMGNPELIGVDLAEAAQP